MAFYDFFIIKGLIGITQRIFQGLQNIRYVLLNLYIENKIISKYIFISQEQLKRKFSLIELYFLLFHLILQAFLT